MFIIFWIFIVNIMFIWFVCEVIFINYDMFVFIDIYCNMFIKYIYFIILKFVFSIFICIIVVDIIM